MNAIKFLLNEHDHVRRVFSNITDESHRPETKCKMLEDLCEELLVHEHMEESVWYPCLKDCDEELTDVIKHLLSEEKKAEKLIKELWQASVQQKWEEKKFKKLKEDVEHHAREEETKLFPRVEDLWEEDELEEMGKTMAMFKKELMRKPLKQKQPRKMANA